MSKPWDHLRAPVKTPLRTGSWTPYNGGKVAIVVQGDKTAHVNTSHWYDAESLAELIEFLEILREQLLEE